MSKTMLVRDREHRQLMRLKISCKAHELNDIIKKLLRIYRTHRKWGYSIND